MYQGRFMFRGEMGHLYIDIDDNVPCKLQTQMILPHPLSPPSFLFG